MRQQDFFDQDEWQTVQFALMWVFRGIAGADGKIDKQEQDSLTKVVASHNKFDNAFLKELLQSLEQNPGIIFRNSVNDPRDYKTGLQEAANILDEKISFADAVLFKKVLISIGVFVANSSGDQAEKTNISEEEVQTLSKLAKYLNINMSELKNPPGIQDILKNFI